MKKIKRGISACLVTTALALLCLSIIALFYKGTMICIATVFQTFGVSVVIHLVLWLLKLWECEYVIVEIILNNLIFSSSVSLIILWPKKEQAFSYIQSPLFKVNNLSLIIHFYLLIVNNHLLWESYKITHFLVNY